MTIRLATQSTANAGENSLAWHSTVVINQLSDSLNALMSQLRDQVIPEPVSPFGRAGLSVDANAEDIETDNPIVVLHKGVRYNIAAIAALDISAAGAAAGATVATSKTGVGWVYVNVVTPTVLEIEVDVDEQAYDSVIAAHAAFAVATNTLPPTANSVCVGAVQVTEGGSGTWTWGTDSITGETEIYYDFYGIPTIVTALASFAATGVAATFAYGTCVLRLGSGTIVSATGKTGVALPSGTAVATGKTGAWLFYILADDVEYAQQLGAAYADLDAARNAVSAHNRNPLMPVAGVIYIENNSGSDFTPGTTNLDASGITTTFVKTAAGANAQGYGGSSLNSPSAVDKIKLRPVGFPS